jgi:hypothetical protein
VSTPSSATHPTGQANLVTFLFLIVLSVIGVGITDFSPADAHRYWLFMIFVCAAVALLGTVARSRGQGGKQHVSRFAVQVLHWSACFVAVLIIYALIHNGRLNNADAGLVIMLLLSLTVFLDGAHVGRHFYLLGTLLGLMTLVMAYIEEFIWVILIISVFITLVAIYWDRLSTHRAKSH